MGSSAFISGCLLLLPFELVLSRISTRIPKTQLQNDLSRRECNKQIKLNFVAKCHELEFSTRVNYTECSIRSPFHLCAPCHIYLLQLSANVPQTDYYCSHKSLFSTPFLHASSDYNFLWHISHIIRCENFVRDLRQLAGYHLADMRR